MPTISIALPVCIIAVPAKTKTRSGYAIAAAIAYPDLVLVFAGTAMMQTGKAIEIVGITMATYLTISLAISVLMNWYNKRIAIQEK